MSANKQITVQFPIFEYTLKVIFARDIVMTGRRLKEDLSNADGAFVTKDAQPFRGWIILGLIPSPGTIAHESSHAVWHMFKSAGVEFEDETFAYHLDFLVRRIHGACK